MERFSLRLIFPSLKKSNVGSAYEVKKTHLRFIVDSSGTPNCGRTRDFEKKVSSKETQKPTQKHYQTKRYKKYITLHNYGMSLP